MTTAKLHAHFLEQNQECIKLRKKESIIGKGEREERRQEEERGKRRGAKEMMTTTTTIKMTTSTAMRMATIMTQMTITMTVMTLTTMADEDNSNNSNSNNNNNNSNCDCQWRGQWWHGCVTIYHRCLTLTRKKYIKFIFSSVSNRPKDILPLSHFDSV